MTAEAHHHALLRPEELAWLRAERRFPVLGTIAGDGTASLSVMWALLQEDGTILLNTRFDRAKGRHVQRDPRVSLCFADRYDYLTLEGIVALRDDPECVDITRLRDHYGSRQDFSPQRGERVTLILTVTRVLRHLDR